jgi:hypothetical protein
MFIRFKKAVLQNPIVLAAPLETRLERRPVTIQLLSPAGFSFDVVQRVSLSALLVPTVLGFLYSLFTAAWTLSLICGLTLLLLGVIFWIIRLRTGMFWQATWHWDSVEVEDGRYSSPINWREPLTAFSGLQKDFGLIGGARKYGSSRQVHGLLLVHPDPQKSILLHASHQAIGEDVVRYYEKQLGTKLLG